jgi:AraC-like DNA-binding protein
MQTDSTPLPIFYVRQVADQLLTMGVNVPVWLAHHGLTEADLANSSVTLTFATFRQLVQEAIQSCQDPALGLLVGQRLLVNTHGVLGYAALNSGSIRHFIELFERYTPVRTPMIHFSHQEQGDLLYLHLHESIPLGDMKRPVFEAVILGLKKVLDSITMGASHIRYAALPFAANGLEKLAADLFKCEVRFNSHWAGFAFERKAVDIALKMADPATFQDAAIICQRELDKLHHQSRLSTHVSRLMLETQGGFPSLEVTARLFHMTARTLHRRLTDEGTSYKAILEGVRHRLATEYLRSGQLSLQEIAYTLGYADMANFRRAFKRWEGVPPSEYPHRATQVRP